jgi:hypothetical protein
MGKKIFISYKYSDTNALQLKGISQTKVRDYVDVIQNRLTIGDHINKGEQDGQSLATLKDPAIQSHLRDKIYDSSITIILMSSNMVDRTYQQNDQWIPWEIAYSLKEHSRDGRTSQCNALLAVIIPDFYGSFNYYMNEIGCPVCNCTIYHTNNMFNIVRNNMFNLKMPIVKPCTNNHGFVYSGEFSYIRSVKWDDFIGNIDYYLDIALKINENISNYHITKTV